MSIAEIVVGSLLIFPVGSDLAMLRKKQPAEKSMR
jgi:hypothetical protein